MKELEELLKKDEQLLAYLCLRSVTPGLTDPKHDILGIPWDVLVSKMRKLSALYSNDRKALAARHTYEGWCKQAFELGYVEIAMKVKAEMDRHYGQQKS